MANLRAEVERLNGKLEFNEKGYRLVQAQKEAAELRAESAEAQVAALREALAEAVERLASLLARGDFDKTDAATSRRVVKRWRALLSPPPSGGQEPTGAAMTIRVLVGAYAGELREAWWLGHSWVRWWEGDNRTGGYVHLGPGEFEVVSR